jgi:hypothetical protein
MRNLPNGFDIYYVNFKTIRRILHIFVAFSEKLNFSLDSIPPPSPSVEFQIMGGKVCLRVKAKHCWALSTNI